MVIDHNSLNIVIEVENQISTRSVLIREGVGTYLYEYVLCCFINITNCVSYTWYNGSILLMVIDHNSLNIVIEVENQISTHSELIIEGVGTY